MIKVEYYKITHSLNYIFLFILSVSLALFLGFNTIKMDVQTGEDLLNVIFVSSSSVIMLYIAILASIYINRDYESKNYQLLVGIGISRKKIILTKYLFFQLMSIMLILSHALAASTIPFLVYKNNIGGFSYLSILSYLFTYCSIASFMFLLSILTQSLVGSILANVAFMMLSSILSVLLIGTNLNLFLIIPIQSLQFISSSTNQNFFEIILFNFLSMCITYIVSHFLFLNQEL